MTTIWLLRTVVPQDSSSLLHGTQLREVWSLFMYRPQTLTTCKVVDKASEAVWLTPEQKVWVWFFSKAVGQNKEWKTWFIFSCPCAGHKASMVGVIPSLVIVLWVQAWEWDLSATRLWLSNWKTKSMLKLSNWILPTQLADTLHFGLLPYQ